MGLKIFKKIFNNTEKIMNNIRNIKKQQMQTFENKADEFISEIEKKQQNYDFEMTGIEWQSKKIRFFEEDIKKMENMTQDEKIKYLAKLREDKRYIHVNEHMV